MRPGSHLITLLWLMLTLAMVVSCGSESAPKRPLDAADRSAPPGPKFTADSNRVLSEAPRLVILISIDTLRADHLGFHGYPRPTSPNLNAFSAKGIVFDDASSTTSWTLPAHASMLTGLNPLRHKVRTDRRAMPNSIPTLATTLAKHGWRTAAVVNSTYLRRENWGLMRGFEDYFWVEETPERISPSTWVTDQAIRWTGQLGPRPTFLFMHYYDVHSDYASLPEYESELVEPYSGIADGTTWQIFLSIVDDEFLAACHRDFDIDRCTIVEGKVLDESQEKVHFDARDIEHLVQLYDAGIRQMDAELARFFDLLDGQGLLEQAVIFITSDHGEEFMDHGSLQHAVTQYQEMLHVPLLVRGPGIPEGVRESTPVSLIDIAPTILGLAGIQVDHEFDGIDLARLWQGQPPPDVEARTLYGEAPGVIGGAGGKKLFRSIREGRYKLQFESYQGTYELYDLEADPNEQTNIAEREPEVRQRLIQAMKKRYWNLEPDDPNAEIGAEDAARLRALGYFR
jgi:arylsulfatase A-like enzyme